MDVDDPRYEEFSFYKHIKDNQPNNVLGSEYRDYKTLTPEEKKDQREFRYRRMSYIMRKGIIHKILNQAYW